MLPALLVAAFTFGAAYVLFERRLAGSPGRRVEPYVRARAAARVDPALPRRERPLAATERHLAKLPGWGRFEQLLERSRPGLPAARMFWACLGGVAVLALLALAAGASAVFVLFLVVAAIVGVRIWLAMAVERRRRAFDDQLPELLGELASALRAGHGFNQALAAVAADAGEPAATEFGRVLAESRLGRPLEDALTDLGTRIGSRDLDFVLDAIIVQHQVGGSLAGIFEVVGQAVRQRHQYALRLRSLTATGRISALVLLALPFVMALLLSVLNHGYFKPLEETSTGRMLVLGSLGLLVVGALWLKRVVSYEGASS